MTTLKSLQHAMQHESYTFDPRPKLPWLISVKRYWHPTLCSGGKDSLTLICTDAIGDRKEHWETTLQHVFDMATSSVGKHVKIREAWVIEAPSHEGSAVPREFEFAGSPVDNYATSIHAFLAGLGTGVNVDFRTRNLVGVGRSVGGTALVLAGAYLPPVTFSSVVLVDPMLQVSSPETNGWPFSLAAGVDVDREVSANGTQSVQYASAGGNLQSWDPRVVDHYVEQEMYGVPGRRPDRWGVEYDTAGLDVFSAESRVHDSLHALYSSTPVHVILGDEPDRIRQQFLGEGAFATVSRVPHAGKKATQLRSVGVACAIAACFQHDASRISANGRDGSRL